MHKIADYQVIMKWFIVEYKILTMDLRKLF
jgi:hypothetical protein